MAETPYVNKLIETAHAEGLSTMADGYGSHTEGLYTVAFGDYSHAGGTANTLDDNTKNPWRPNTHYYVGERVTFTDPRRSPTDEKVGLYCVTEHTSGVNTNTVCSGLDGFIPEWRVLPGQFGSVYAEMIGNGSDTEHRSNARTLTWRGDEYIAGNMSIAGGSLTLGTGVNRISLSATELKTLKSLVRADGVSF